MTSNKWWRVVNILLEGHGIRGTAKIVKLSHTRVRQIADDAIASGVLVKVSENNEVSLYSRGPNYPQKVERGVSTASNPQTDPPDGVGPLELVGGEIEPGFIPMRLHVLGHRFQVKRGPSKEVPWTKTTVCSSVPNHVLIIPMGPTDERPIKIVYREGKEDRSLDIWTPNVLITNPTALQNFPGWAAGRAQRIANWLSRHYGFEFGIMEACQDFEMAAALPNDIAQLAKELKLKLPDLWVDTSRGHGEMETRSPEKALEIMTLPTRITNLEKRDAFIEENMLRLVAGQERLADRMEALTARLLDILGMKQPEKSEPIQTDPGGMFG